MGPVTQCQALEYMRKYHPEVLEKERLRVRKYRGYRCAEGWYEKQREDQKGLCAICGNPPGPHRSLSVDHDHETGKVRALLCGPCNRGLGHFRDNPRLLASAVEYLKRFAASEPPDFARPTTPTEEPR